MPICPNQNGSVDNASDGLIDDILGFFGRAGHTLGVHFGKIVLQLLRQLTFPVVREGWLLECPNTDRFILENGTAKKVFDDGFLVGR
jgi:hypothetical protein